MRINLADSFVFKVNSTDNVSRYGEWLWLPAEGREIWTEDGCDAKECTLREAIVSANLMPNFAEPDVIEFDIPGSGVQTINLNRRPYDNRTDTQGDLPPIIDPVTIDGYTQPGASANTNPLSGGSNARPLIELSLESGTGDGLAVATDNTTIRGLVINRASTEDRNSFGDAIYIRGSENVVAGNFLGTDPAGNTKSGDDLFTRGVHIYVGADNTIGGTAPADRNVISGNSQAGVFLDGPFFPDDPRNIARTRIQGNYIGTNAAGTGAVGRRSGSGIRAIGIAQNAVTDSTIGGGAGNLIAGHEESEISLGGAGVTGGRIQGNLIGTQRDGATAIDPESTNSGSAISIAGSSDFTVGGLARGEANTIAFKAWGVSIDAPNTDGAGDYNRILGNSIHSNGGPGITLNGGPVTPNDLGDTDSGPNQQQNFPVLTSASVSGGNATVSGRLNSSANTTFRLEFFSNAACDPPQPFPPLPGHGEGQRFIGSANVTTDGSGNASFGPLTFTSVPSGQSVITATATDPEGNTSEFSQCQSGTTNSPPAATDDSYSTEENQPLDVPAPGVLANDTDPEGGTLTAVKVSDPTNGTLNINADGSFTYTPDAGFSGTDTFTYKANDGTNDGNTVTVSITVTPVDTPAPMVTSVSPADQATGVSRSTSVTAIFTVAMKPSLLTNPKTQKSTTFILMGPSRKGTIQVSAKVTCNDPCTTATLTPSKSLAANTTYVATIKSGVEDTSGRKLESDYIWSFRTGG